MPLVLKHDVMQGNIFSGLGTYVVELWIPQGATAPTATVTLHKESPLESESGYWQATDWTMNIAGVKEVLLLGDCRYRFESTAVGFQAYIHIKVDASVNMAAGYADIVVED